MRTTLTITLVMTVLLTTGSQIQAAQKIDLRFRPTAGDKQTLRVTSTLNMSMKMGEQQQDLTNIRTIILAMEPVETAADGMVQVRVRFVTIQEKGGMKGAESGVGYDSTKPQDSEDPLARHYSAFIGQSFLIKVSPKGEIVDLGTDELFLAVAGNLMEQEDKMMRERLREKADQAIERTNQRFGSREKRKLALKEQVEKFPLLDKNRIQGLLGDALVRFPANPVQIGENWEGPVIVNPGSPLEMTGAYTLKAAEDSTCTIEAGGQRSFKDEPIVSQAGPVPMSMKLAGTWTATITVATKTGLLLSRRAQMKFAGEVQESDPLLALGPVPRMALEGTTTVERVEPPVAPSRTPSAGP